MSKAMKFEIYRISDWCRENIPCEGAKLVRAGSVFGFLNNYFYFCDYGRR